jgi:hypothetical protein
VVYSKSAIHNFIIILFIKWPNSFQTFYSKKALQQSRQKEDGEIGDVNPLIKPLDTGWTYGV